MAAATLRAVLRQIHRTVAAQGIGCVSDAELLHRFQTQLDEAAFEVLVWRHGAMVLQTCQRILTCDSDVEDAFQGTFIALVRGGGSIRRRDTVAGWLYRVAYHVALRIETANRKRRRFQASAVRRNSVPSTLENTQDLREALDREINRLPAKYRAPFVLCYLNGKTTTEAAEILQLPRGTVGTRLAWARHCLRGRLTRSGLGMAALLSASTTVQASNLTKLVDATLQTCVVVIQGTVAAGATVYLNALAVSTLRGFVLAKMKAGVGVALAVCVAFAGTGIFVHRMVSVDASDASFTTALGAQPTESSTEPANTSNANSNGDTAGESEQPISLSGVVVDFNGKPIVNASVHLRESPSSRESTNWYPSETRDLACTETDAEGRFAFDRIKPQTPRPLRPLAFPVDVAVLAKDFGMAWRHVANANSRPIRLRMGQNIPIKGELVDPKGSPVADARIRVREIAALDDVELAESQSQTYLDMTWFQSAPHAITRSDGHFEIQGIPPGVRVALLVDDPRFVRQDIYASNTDKQLPPLHRTSFGGQDRAPHTVYSNAFKATVLPAGRVRCKVVFDDTGAPANGASWAEPPRSSPPNRTLDEHGGFTLNGLQPGTHRINVFPPPGSAYLRTVVPIEVTDADAVIEPLVRLPKGTVVLGDVIDAETGRGVPSVELENILRADAKLRDVRGWKTTTDEQGRFELAVPAGESVIVLTQVPFGYLSHGVLPGKSLNDADKEFAKTVRPDAGKPSERIRFTLRRGSVTHIQAVDPNGKAVPGAVVTIARHVGNGSMPTLALTTDAEGRISLSGLRENEDVVVILTKADRQLGAQVLHQPKERNGKTNSIEVMLQPTGVAEGRVLDENKLPMPGARVGLTSWERNPNMGHETKAVYSDGEGRFTVPDLIPGAAYLLSFEADGYARSCTAQFTAESGVTRVVEDEILTKTDQVVAGRVVDRDGKPLPGVSVNATYNVDPKGPGGRVGSRLTDIEGRFRLRDLPRGSISLRVNIPGVRRGFEFPDIDSGREDVEISVDVKRPD